LHHEEHEIKKGERLKDKGQRFKTKDSISRRDAETQRKEKKQIILLFSDSSASLESEANGREEKNKERCLPQRRRDAEKRKNELSCSSLIAPTGA